MGTTLGSILEKIGHRTSVSQEVTPPTPFVAPREPFSAAVLQPSLGPPHRRGSVPENSQQTVVRPRVDINKASARLGDAKLPTSERLADFMRPSGVKETNSRKTLPPSQFVSIPLKSVPGNLVWLNWDMLEEMDPSMKLHNRTMGDHLEYEILRRYCKIKDDSFRHGGEVGFADKYRLFFDNGSEGSGRLCMLESGESLKGIGATPLAFAKKGSHSDGCTGLEEAVLEAAAGETLAHLAEEKNKTSRVLAIIAPKVEWNVPNKEAQPMIIVRLGMNVRPAHFTVGTGFRPTGIDSRKLAKASDNIFQQGRSQLEDEGLLRDHARTAARLGRWRIEHGSVNETNMTLDGGSLDFGTFSTQPHTAPIYTQSSSTMCVAAILMPAMTNAQIYGAEHKMVPLVLDPILNNVHQWKNIYKEENNVQTLFSLGLPAWAANDMLTRHPEESALLAKHIRYLGKLFYKNHPSDSRNNWDKAVGASFVDQRGLLQKLPNLFFDRQSGQQKTVSDKEVIGQLEVLRQSRSINWNTWRRFMPINKYAIKNEEEGFKRIAESVSIINKLYPKLIHSAGENGVKEGRWSSFEDFLVNIESRATRENLPLQSLYAPVLRGKIKDAIKSYEDCMIKSRQQDPEAGDVDAKNELFSLVSSIIDSTISDSKRRVDDMLYRSTVEKSDEPGVYYLQRQIIDNVSFHLEAHDDGRRFLCVAVPEQQLRKNADDPADSSEPRVFKYQVKPYQYETFDANSIDGAGFLPSTRKYSYAVPNTYELNKIIENGGLR